MEQRGTPSLIPYEAIVRDCLRHVVREVLGRVAAEGMQGEHHFYIGFRTHADGVVIPSHLRAQYPEEMTIVLQHQFQHLEVDEQGFSVSLSFGGVLSHLRIPLAALTSFVDPAVGFALRFESVTAPEAKAEEIPEPRVERAEGTVVKVDFSKKR